MRARISFVPAAIALLGLYISPTEAANPNLSGYLSVNFDYYPGNPNNPDDHSYWYWNGVSGSLSLAIPSVINTTIKPSVIGPTTLYWADAGNWTQPPLDTGGVSIGQSGSGTYNASINHGQSTLDVFRGFGPVEGAQTLSQVDITQASGTGQSLHYPDFSTAQSNFATSKFNVTIPSGARVSNNQYQVIVENLAVQSGGTMLDPLAIIRHDLTNHGSGNFGGQVQGNFINDAIAANGNVANSNNIVLLGQLQNTGELYIPNTLETDAATSNAGSIFVNAGNLVANAPFINNGSVSVSGYSYVRGTGTFTNNGSFQWTGGQISGGANFVNNSNSFTISGADSKLLFEPFTNAGTISYSGGGDLSIGNASTLANQAGALYNITDNSSILAGYLGGSISNAGVLRKSGGTGTSIVDVSVTNSGKIAVNAGKLSFTSSLSLSPSSTLEFQLRGVTPSTDFGKLNKNAILSLAGALAISFGSGFGPALNDSFDLFDWQNGVTGSFSSLQLPPLASGLKWDASQLYTDGSLSVGVGIPGDFDENGIVDAADFIIWRKYLNTTYSQSDYGIWRAHFGQIAGSGSGASVNTAVPEPATLALMISATAGWCLRRRRAA
jgi:hypothetical protein